MIEYVEVEEPRELVRLSSKLTTKLKARMAHSETRYVGDPSGTYRRKVYFANGTETGLYWSFGFSKGRAAAQNLFGIGTPGNSEQLLIWVQFNVPLAKFSRRFGGAFLRHLPTNRIVLAHRGIVTLGRSRVNRSIVFREMDVTLREAATSKGPARFLLIGALDSPTLVGDLREFTEELRRVVRQPAGRARLKQTSLPHESKSAQSRSIGRLRAYFDEPSGPREVKARERAVADCYHGSVVRALRQAFRESIAVLKSREVDLTVITSTHALLFEVKTAITPQDIYTAIGQLAAHAPIVARYTKSLNVTKIVVLPDRPSRRFCELFAKSLNIRVVTFRRSVRGRITFEGLGFRAKM